LFIAIRTPETKLEYSRKWYNENIEKCKEKGRRSTEKQNLLFVNCPNCDKKLKKRSLRLHLKNHCHHKILYE
jgi:hypothetical protein